MNDRIKDAFDKIHAEDELKSRTKEFLLKETNAYRKKTTFSYKYWFAITCFLFIVLIGGSYYTYYTPIITISVDVNPSIELGINQFDKVIMVESYNEDGNIILSSLNIYNLHYIDALNKILTDKNMESYLTPEQLATITIFGKNKKKQNKMLTKVSLCTASYQNISCTSGRPEEVAAAHAVGLSCGKYRAFLELQALDPEITPEDVQGLTMRQIREKINALSTDTTTENKEQNWGNGTGCGNGIGFGHNRKDSYQSQN